MSALFSSRHALKKKGLHFCKMQSLGNDFMVLDAVTQKVFFSEEQIRKLADRHYGVGFDQLLLVEPPYDPDLDFHYRMFNANGQEIAQCGNGACALAYFVRLKGLTNRRTIRISTHSGQLLLSVLADDRIKLTLGEPCFEPTKIPFKADRREKKYCLQLSQKTVSCGVVAMGNPHCVLAVQDCRSAPVLLLGAQITTHERFAQQTNVGFMQIVSPQQICLRVYERGVGETQACGSGACAAVACGIDQGLLASRVLVDLPGGTLQVQWLGPGHPLSMISVASLVYEGWLPW